LVIEEGGKIKDVALYGELARLMKYFGGDVHKIKKAYGIDNMNLRNGFEAIMESIWQKHKDSPNLFKKLEWEKLPWINENVKRKLNENEAAFVKRKQEYEKQRDEALRRQQFIQYLKIRDETFL